MELLSYFLPKTYLNDTGCNIFSIKSYKPVFSFTFDDVDDAADYDDMLPKEPSYISDLRLINSGTSIFYDTNPTRPGFIMLYKSRKFCDDKLTISKGKTCRLYRYYPHRLYDCELDVCFLVTLESDGDSFTRVCVSFVQLDNFNEWQLVEDAFVITFSHLFSRCYCFLSEKEKKIVVITGNYVEGFLEDGQICDSYLNILSYSSASGSLEIQLEKQRSVTESCDKNCITNVYFTLDGTKILLLSTKLYYLVTYSLTQDVFGNIYEWDGSEHNPQWYYYFYAYHKIYGNIFMICETDGKIRILCEVNLNMVHLQDESLSLCELGLPCGTFVFYHVDYFDTITVYVTAGVPKQLLILDSSRKKIMGKYLPHGDCNIVEVNTNWSGEEVFLLICTPSGFSLDILYVNRKSSLKSTCKLAILQLYPSKVLKELDLPRQLKDEISKSLLSLKMLNSKKFCH